MKAIVFSSAEYAVGEHTSATFVVPIGLVRELSVFFTIPDADIDDGLNEFNMMVQVDVSGAWKNMIGFGWKGGYTLQVGEVTRQPSCTLKKSAFFDNLGGKSVRIVLAVQRAMSLSADIEII